MPNPLLQVTQQSEMNNITNLYKNIKNPIAYLNNMATQNPNLMPIVNMVNNGVNPDEICRMLLKQKGINEQEFINYLNNMRQF